MTYLNKLHKSLHKTRTYTRGALGCMMPEWVARRNRHQRLQALARMTDDERQAILERVNYYNRLDQPFDASLLEEQLGEFRRKGSWAYYLDFMPLMKGYPEDIFFSVRFGDNKRIPEQPAFMKCRPIGPSEKNMNSILLKLNQVRHYYSVSDNISFEHKKNMAVWRGKAFKQHRRDFLERHFSSAFCNIGDTRCPKKHPEHYRNYMSVAEQLEYKYIISIEGNDVATNLKWIMASNSLCMMRKPKYETWFMEGRLTPGVHFVQLADDYSDLESKIEHYNQQPEEAKAIIRAAQEHFQVFRQTKREELIAHLVIARYLLLSGQLDANSLPDGVKEMVTT